MINHYIIGDVHGEYETLLALVSKLPQESELIFVGDLVDRGLQSKEVVEFVRQKYHQVVMGNHEVLMIKYGEELLATKELPMNNTWMRDGGIETLLSYGLLAKAEDGSFEILNDETAIEHFQEVIKWMRRLPRYLELDAQHPSGKKVIVSHSNISRVWSIRHDQSKQKEFISEVLWTRDFEVAEESDIFNVYGHTPQKYRAKVEQNYACIDTGCCYSEYEEFGVLSAYCVESGEVVEVCKRDLL